MQIPIFLLALWLPLLACGSPAVQDLPGDGPPAPRRAESQRGEPGAGERPRRSPDGGAPARALGPPPVLVGEIRDGTILDVVGTPAGPWITSGRNVWRLDPLSGEALELHPASPFPHTVTALELAADGTLWVSTSNSLHALDPAGEQRTFEGGELGTIADFKLLGDTGAVAVLAGSELVVLERRGARELALRARSGEFEELLSLERLQVFEHGSGFSAYVVGAPRNARLRLVRALVRVELTGKDLRPRIQAGSYDPTAEFDDPTGSTRALCVVEHGGRRVAYVAAGAKGQLVRLDVTDPARLRTLERIVLHEGQRVLNVAVDRERDLLYAVSANRLHVLEARTGKVLGAVPVAFQDGGERGMGLCVLPDGRRILWTGNRHEVEYALHAIDVSQPTAPRRLTQRWWISSSDGAVVIPEWDSVYLPTWGGVARYDISDPARPVPRGYQPAGVGATEHIAWIWKDPESREEAFLVTPAGNGPILLWPVSREEPDPGPPQRFDFMLPGLKPNRFYQNDAVPYRRNGELYLLSDLGCRERQRNTLRAVQVSSGRWAHVHEEHAELRANAQGITIAGDLAFVTVVGGFYVVRLDLLPERLEVVGEHVLREGPGHFRASGLALSADGRHIFVGRDSPGIIVSLAYDPRRHRVEGPLSVLADLPGIGRMRLHAPSQRLYAAARGGNVLELDVSEPARLRLVSTWKAPGYDGNIQDVRPFETSDGLLLLVAKNNEGFALLGPDAER